MKKHLIIILVMAAMLLLPLSSAFADQSWRRTSGVEIWDPDKAYNGYTIHTPDDPAWLIDMQGRVVNTWNQADGLAFASIFYPLETGNWRAQHNPPYLPPNAGNAVRGGGAQGRIEEYDWNGNRTWWWDGFDGVVDDGTGNPTTDLSQHTRRMHHDLQRMYNKALGEWTYIFQVWTAKDQTDADNMGVDPNYLGTSRGTNATWSPDGLMEVRPLYDVTDNTPLNNNSAEIVWFWSFADHMVTTFDTGATVEWTDWSGRTSTPPLVVTDTDGIAANPQLLDVNGIHYDAYGGPRVDYQHTNSFDYDERTGHIVINAKACNEFFVIDHDGTFVADATPGTVDNGFDTNEVGALARTSAGDFLYRWGAPWNYYRGEPPSWRQHNSGEMYGAHDVQFIEPFAWRPPMAAGDNWAAPGAEHALPGGGDYDGMPGNFLIFDNSCYNPRIAEGSHIIEINPYENDGGAADDTLSGFQLAGTTGYVNPADLARRKQVVWDYSSGTTNFYGNAQSGTQRLPNGNTLINNSTEGHVFEVDVDKNVVWSYVTPSLEDGVYTLRTDAANNSFRSYRISPDHPALAGKNLKPGNTLSGVLPGEAAGGAAPEPPPPAPTGWGTSGLTAGEGGGGSAGGTGGSDTGGGY